MARQATGSVRYSGGRWWARVTAHGKRALVAIEPPITDPAAREAAEAEARILSQIARARLRPGAPGELAEDWYERWLQARKERGVSPRQPRSHLKTHILPILRGKPMAKVTPADLERVVRHLDDLVARGELRWKSAINVWGTVTKSFDDAHRGKLAELRCRDDNPAKAVRGPDRGVATEKVHLFPPEFLALVSCESVPLARRRAYAIGVYLYLRPAELEALVWSDLDLERGQGQIRRSIDRESGDEKAPKAGHARAPHDLEPTILPLLRAMHRESGGRGPVVGRIGDERELAEQLRRDLLTAGVTRVELHVASDDPPREWMRMHDLRTTGVTWMAVRGDEPMVIMARAGHADLKTTLGYVSRAALVRRGYGSVFPELPACLLESAPKSAPKTTARRKTQGLVAEAHGNRTDRAPGQGGNPSRISLAQLRAVTRDDAAKYVEARDGANSSAEWPRARKELVYRLAEAMKRAVARDDHEAARRLHEEIGRHLGADAAPCARGTG